MRIQVSDGISLHCTDAGAGRPMVFLTGYGGPISTWRPQSEHFSRDHRVVCIDRRSHGLSDRPDFGHRVARHAADVHDVLVQLELQDVLLIGHSMGASTVMAYLDVFADDRLRGVVLIDQTPKVINEGDWQLGSYGLTRDTLEDWLAAFPANIPEAKRELPQWALELSVEGPPFSVDETRGLLRDHVEKDWRDVIRRCPVPLLAIGGGQSVVWSAESSAWMAQAAPDGTYVLIEDAGHAPQFDEPAQLNAAIAAFAMR